MAIFIVTRDRDDGVKQIDDIDTAVVEAADIAAARTAALALDSRFPANYWATAVAVDIEASAYLGGMFRTVQDNGV